jgi:hypothetical protein
MKTDSFDLFPLRVAIRLGVAQRVELGLLAAGLVEHDSPTHVSGSTCCGVDQWLVSGDCMP